MYHELRKRGTSLLLEHDPPDQVRGRLSGRARGHAFPKTGIHPGSSPGQAFAPAAGEVDVDLAAVAHVLDISAATAGPLVVSTPLRLISAVGRNSESVLRR